MAVKVRESKSGAVSYEVSWRGPAHTQKCAPGCVKAVHQHTRTVTSRTEADDLDRDMKAGRAVMRKAGITEHVGTVAPKAAPVAGRTFRSVALDTIAYLQGRGFWSEGHCRGQYTALRQMGAWADQPVTVCALDLDGAETVISGHKYQSRAVAIMKQTMEYAVRKDLITAHRLSPVRADRSRVPASRREFIETSAAQIKKIAAGLDAWRPGLGLSMYLMRYTGMRPGEVLGLMSDDFRTDAKGQMSVTISRQRDSNGKVITLKGKRAGESRTLPVPANVARMVTEHVTAHGQGWMFRSLHSDAIDRDAWGQKAKAAAGKAGLPAAWVPYQLRHLYASDLISRGVLIDRVAKFMGHSDIKVTFRTYSHLMTSELDDLRAMLPDAV